MKKKSFLAVLCSAALLLQLAPAVLADDVLSDATTDEIVTTEEGVTDFGEFGNALWVLKGDTLTLSGKGDLPDDVHDNYVNTISNIYYLDKIVYYPWMKYRSVVKHLVIENGIQDIPKAAFAYFYALETVDFPSTPITIRDHAFYAKDFDIRDGLVCKNEL